MMKGGVVVSRIIRRIKAADKEFIMRKRVAAYARVSSGKTAMLHSLSTQVSYYSQMIQENPKWEYAGVYADEAVTGTKDTRDQFQKLLKDCRDGKIDMIITKSISRFARNTLILLRVVRELKEINVDVYFEKENIHSISGDGELMLTILASFAQAESLSVSENCKWRIRKSFSEGELANLRFMFGYVINSRGIEINQKEAFIVRQVFDDYLSGMGTTQIAKKLRKMKVQRLRGGIWTPSRVGELLKNEKYIGDAILQKKYVINHLTKKLIKNNGELPKYYVENSHQAIINKSDFQKVKERLTQNAEMYAGRSEESIAKNAGRSKKRRYVFTKKITCSVCGKNFIRKASHGRVYWGCFTYLHFSREACEAGQIPEGIIIEKIKEVLELDEFSDETFNQEIKGIKIPAPFEMAFIMKDGSEILSRWEHKSRKDSWDEEAKETASLRELNRREELSLGKRKSQ